MLLSLEQKKIINDFPDKHMFVKGVAGSGKTLIAIEKYRKLITMGISPNDILFLTYNNALTGYINSYLKDIKKNIATTYHKYVKNIAYSYHDSVFILDGANLKIAVDTTMQKMFGKAYTQMIDKYPVNFLIKEFQFIEDFRIQTLEGYQNKREKTFTDIDCANVWWIHKIYKIVRKSIVYNHNISYKKIYDWPETANIVISKAKNDSRIKKYKYVIVDEFQDFSVSMTLSLLAFLKDKNKGLICFGDDNQSIYGERSCYRNLPCLGCMQIYSLPKNYRNSKNIAQFSKDILSCLDKNFSTKDNVTNVELFVCGDEEHRYRIIKNIVKKVVESSENICIVTPYQDKIINLYKFLKKEFGQIQDLLSYKEDSDFDFNRNIKINISTYQSIKGLEFDNLVILLEPYGLQKKLLYSVVTRAKYRIYFLQTRRIKMNETFPYHSSYFVARYGNTKNSIEDSNKLKEKILNNEEFDELSEEETDKIMKELGLDQYL